MTKSSVQKKRKQLEHSSDSEENEKEVNTTVSAGMLSSQQLQQRVKELDAREARLLEREQNETAAVGANAKMSATNRSTSAESFLSMPNSSTSSSLFSTQPDFVSSSLSGFPAGNAAAIMALFFEQQADRLKDDRDAARDAAATLRLKLMMNYLQPNK